MWLCINSLGGYFRSHYDFCTSETQIENIKDQEQTGFEKVYNFYCQTNDDIQIRTERFSQFIDIYNVSLDECNQLEKNLLEIGFKYDRSNFYCIKVKNLSHFKLLINQLISPDSLYLNKIEELDKII